jgi:cysteine desulfuration protein SufE
MTSKEIEIIEEFEIFDDWLDKYNYIIDLGKELPIIDSQYKTNDNLIDGCQSRVWVASKYKDGKMYYYADSDAIISKGVISLLIKVLSGEKPENIVHSNLDFLEKIGLQSHLSPTRANGLQGMIKRMKLDALKHTIK